MVVFMQKKTTATPEATIIVAFTINVQVNFALMDKSKGD